MPSLGPDVAWARAGGRWVIETFDEARRLLGPKVASGLESALQRFVSEAHLAQMLTSHLETGGKRLRALVPLWIHVNRGGEIGDVLPMALGVDLLHNATLVHDDLQDGDTHRRGKPTVWRQYGEAQSINAGDALYFAGLASLLEAPAGRRVASPVCRAMTRVIEGQVSAFRFQETPGSPAYLAPDLEAWSVMARGKG